MFTVIVFIGVLAGPIYGGMPEKAEAPRISRAELVFPGGGKASYVTDPKTGCIQYFMDAKGEKIEPNHPAWLANDRKIYDIGSFNDTQCRQGVIAINSCPIEYNGIAHGTIFCIGAWDWANKIWYQPCRESYPRCP